MGEVNCHCRKTKALAVQSQGEIWAAGTFLYSGPSRRLCSSLLRQRLLWLDLHFIKSRVASRWGIPCVVGCRGRTEQDTKQGGKNPCFKSQKRAHEAACGKNGECSSHSHTSFVCVATSISLPALFQVRSGCAGCVPIVQEPKSPSAEPLKAVASSLHLARPLTPRQCYPNPPPVIFPKATCSFLFEHSDLSLSLFFYQPTCN